MVGRLPADGGGVRDRVSGVGRETEHGEESRLEWIDPGQNGGNNWPVANAVIS
jgi:hypothetical protein